MNNRQNTTDSALRAQVNEAAGTKNDLALLILGVDWYDTESQARRVISHYYATMLQRADECSVTMLFDE